MGIEIVQHHNIAHMSKTTSISDDVMGSLDSVTATQQKCVGGLYIVTFLFLFHPLLTCKKEGKKSRNEKFLDE